MAVNPPNLNMDNVAVDNSSQIGVSGSDVKQIVGTMGALVQGLSKTQADTIKVLGTQRGDQYDTKKILLYASIAFLAIVAIYKFTKKRKR